MKDGFLCTADTKYAYLDITKPVLVPRPTLWEKARYVLGKVIGAVLAAIGFLYPGSWLIFVHFKGIDIFTDNWAWLNHSGALIAGPLALLAAAVYMWYRGCGSYHTVAEWATFRDRALLSDYSEIVNEHGLQKAARFMTPRELRSKLLRQANEKGIHPLVKDASVLEWLNIGVLLPEEAEPVNDIQRQLREAEKNLRDVSTALEFELVQLTDKAAKERNRKIADAELAYAACAEAKLMELYTSQYNERVNKVRKERDEKLAKLNNTANMDPAKRQKKKKKIERKCERSEQLEEALFQEQIRANLPALKRRARERDDTIAKAREEYQEHTNAVRIDRQIDVRLKQAQSLFDQRLARLQSNWDALVASKLDRNNPMVSDAVHN